MRGRTEALATPVRAPLFLLRSRGGGHEVVEGHAGAADLWRGRPAPPTPKSMIMPFTRAASGASAHRRTHPLAAVLLAVGLVVLAGPAAADPARLALVGAKVFPAPNQPPIEDAVVLIESGRIAAVGPRSVTPVPDGYEVLDQVGRSVTAGFWNSHVHLTRPAFAKAAAASDGEVQAELEAAFTRWGFTTVVDLASTTEVANSVKARLAAGQVRGPRVLSVGEPFYPPDGTPVYARPIYEAYGLPSAEIRSPEQAAERVAAQVAAGADAVKLFTGSIQGGADEVAHMSPEAVRAITGAAERLDKPAFAHPTDRAGLEVAVQNGVDVLAHAAPLTGEWSAEYAAGLAARGVALLPTLELYETAAHPDTPVGIAVQQARALAQAGGVVLFGTDVGFTDAFDTSAEMRLMNEALGFDGLLASLTTAPGALFGEQDVRGRIAPGQAADLVVLGGDPSRDLSAMSDVRLVIRAGEVVYAAPGRAR